MSWKKSILRDNAEREIPRGYTSDISRKTNPYTVDKDGGSHYDGYTRHHPTGRNVSYDGYGREK